MPRAIWRGSISFGLVTVPVGLYAAVKRRDIRFKEVDRVTGQRVRHLRVRELWADRPDAAWQPPEPSQVDSGAAPRPAGPAGAPPASSDAGRQPSQQTPPSVSRDEIIHGYEISPGRYVEVSDEDLAALRPEHTKTIDVEQFVSRKDLDPLYFESSYYVVPEQERVRPFALLLRAMQESNRAAICWLVLRSRRHLAALQPRGNLMLLTTLLFADEIVPAQGLEPRLPSDLSEREVEMAEILVNTLSGPFEPERYRDEYREQLLQLIESRAGQGQAVREPALPPAPSGIEDLMSALTASVEQARARQKDARRKATS
jgi:DNA end-binding protein Ku